MVWFKVEELTVSKGVPPESKQPHESRGNSKKRAVYFGYTRFRRNQARSVNIRAATDERPGIGVGTALGMKLVGCTVAFSVGRRVGTLVGGSVGGCVVGMGDGSTVGLIVGIGDGT